uniref:Helitron_like_N domain-containing protein n=1 Tax=Caenorhabditis tropicalis TaxID=1561998 RepID=A0A1I7TFX1_9PELO
MEKAEDLCNNVATYHAFAKDELDSLRSRVYYQLTFKICGPKDMTPDEVKKRQLFRMPFHTFEKDEEKYVSVCKLWDELLAEYMVGSPKRCTSPVSEENEGLLMEQEEEEGERADGNVVSGDGDDEEIIDNNAEVRNDDIIGIENGQLDEDMESVGDEEEEEEAAQEEIIQNETERNIDVNDVISTPKRPRMNEHGTIDDDVVEFMEEEHGTSARRLMAGDPITKAIIEYYTRARRCDKNCPVVDKREAAVVHDVLLAEITNGGNKEATTFNDLMLSALVYEWNGEIKSVQKYIEQFQQCYQGIRSILKRFREIDLLKKMVFECADVLRQKNVDVMKAFLKLIHLSDEQRLKFDDYYVKPKSQDHHKQGYVDEKNAALGETFKTEMKRAVTTKVCDVCSQYTSQNYLFKEPVSQWRRCLTKKFDGVNDRDNIRVCQMCKRDMLSGRNKYPRAALVNNFVADECPEELRCLNYLESILIERARANMKTCYLKSVSGKTTAMKSTNAVLVVLPTEIEATLKHVAKTLPSAECLNIQVRTGWGKEYIVSMAKVVRALEWLKENNKMYEDIEIDRNFKFVLNKDVMFEDPNATQQDADDLITDNYLLTQVYEEEIEEQPTRHIVEKTNEQTAFQKYSLKKNPYIPISLDSKNLDLMIFPKLHPYGEDGMDSNRKQELMPTKYVRTRLRARCRYWARSVPWLCYSFGRKQQLMLTSVQGIQARVRRGTTKENFDLADLNNQKRLLSAYSKSRGFPQYWKSVKFALRSHIIHYGPPTWFLTLNPNTKGWKDLHKVYSKILEEEINETNIDAAIAKDPEVFSRYWRTRVAVFWKTVILERDNPPLGLVTHYFHRVEYQHRGTQHLHCVLWTKERPGENATAVEIADFIDQYVTARMPHETEEKELHDIIVNNQMHWANHSKTCRRVARYQKRCYKTKCRFGFPRPELRRTIYFDDIKKCRVPGVTNRPYLLARTKNEILVNDYNPIISRLWNANTDVQYIPHKCRDIVNYICAYTTKGEKAKRRDKVDVDKYALQGLSKSKALFKVGLEMAEQREVGMLELIDDLMGHPNYGFDQAHINIPTDAYDNRLRALRPRDELKNKDDPIHMSSMLDDYYPERYWTLRIGVLNDYG